VNLVDNAIENNAIENPVKGTATIDGAHYEWTGNLTAKEFDIKFTGSRYEGHLELARTRDKGANP
jgi:hypothetical protein